MSNRQQSSSQEDVDTLIHNQAQRLFSQRVYLTVHVTLFAVVIILTRGQFTRMGMAFAAWAVILLAHFVFMALYEQREFTIRQGYRKRKLREQSQNDSEPDVFYDIGEDGELVPFSEDHFPESRRHDTS